MSTDLGIIGDALDPGIHLEVYVSGSGLVLRIQGEPHVRKLFLDKAGRDQLRERLDVAEAMLGAR